MDRNVILAQDRFFHLSGWRLWRRVLGQPITWPFIVLMWWQMRHSPNPPATAAAWIAWCEAGIARSRQKQEAA